MELESPIATLSDEMLTIVFSHLDVNERLTACLVCKKWFKLINCRSLLRDVIVRVTDCKKNDTTRDITTMWDNEAFLSPWTRNFCNVYFYNVAIGEKYNEMFENLKLVERLTLVNCELNRTDKSSFAISLENLHFLRIHNSSSWYEFLACPNLSELIITGSQLNDSKFAILQKTMKRLKILTIQFDIPRYPVVYGLFYRPSVKYEENVSLLPAIKSFVSESAATLSELNVECRFFTASEIKELFRIKDLNLRKISVRINKRCSFDTPKAFVDLLKGQRNLKALDLRECDLHDDMIDGLCTVLPDIEELRIEFIGRDKSLKNVFNLKKLKKLEICNSEGVTSSGFHEAISNFKPIEISELNLSHIIVSTISARSFMQLTKLVNLSLRSCHLNDFHVHIISTYLVTLKQLDLDSNNDITDDGLAAVSTPDENQDPVPSVNKDGFKALHNLKSLRELDVSYCRKITDEGLIAAIRFKFLQSLNLEELDISSNTRLVLYGQNPKLKKIYPIYISL